ncbi:DUF4056 domain-containing protein [Vibrio sp. SCSIO 43135]|uniref:DUF4056 domain-containing protein n=1 Tax=Vibrio sp. SCSIO 43135 TaxID=2819096 RepID=UPI002075CA05|nr:DUF4056 domain-containing protein [Vibrio sp. SCSIO 43135]USD43528.1 DUF4056 domain-containing protein [Vibrio sp. SCSIO 43135]
MTRTLSLLTVLLGLSTQVFALEAPVGVRPCCAFGKDLKAKLVGVPVPFFSLGNTLDADDIGDHKYNDGSSSVSASLLGMADEKNGLIFTEKGGFIDTAHVRDTADYTYYLFHQNQQHFGQDHYIELPDELRTRRIQWHAHENSQLTAQQRLKMEVQSASLIAFRLAQWHEIAQWFGMISVGGFDELASAFSSEDLYSNMLGAQLASAILLDNPNLSSSEFAERMDDAFAQALNNLKAQPKSVTDEKIEQLDGKWWDSSKRLPNKWAVLFRDYRFGLTLTPNYSGSSHELSLPSQFDNGDDIEQWVSLELHKSDLEKHFEALPDNKKQQEVWYTDDFQPLADFAKQADEAEYRQILEGK